jgi:hypothetical protein
MGQNGNMIVETSLIRGENLYKSPSLKKNHLAIKAKVDKEAL